MNKIQLQVWIVKVVGMDQSQDLTPDRETSCQCGV